MAFIVNIVLNEVILSIVHLFHNTNMSNILLANRPPSPIFYIKNINYKPPGRPGQGHNKEWSRYGSLLLGVFKI